MYKTNLFTLVLHEHEYMTSARSTVYY